MQLGAAAVSSPMIVEPHASLSAPPSASRLQFVNGSKMNGSSEPWYGPHSRGR